MWVVLVIPVLIMLLALGMEGVESRLGIERGTDPNEPDEFAPGLNAATLTMNVPAQDRRPINRRPEGRRSRDVRLRDRRVQHRRPPQDTTVALPRPRPVSTGRMSGVLRTQ
jgi:hypothetical protein